MRTESGFELHGPALFLISLGVVIWYSYFWLLEGLFGTTVGKFLLAMKVLGDHGAKVGVGKAYVRTLLRFVDGIGFYFVGALVALASEKRQRLGDMVAETLVVETPVPPRKERLAAVFALIAIPGSCLVIAVLLHRI